MLIVDFFLLIELMDLTVLKSLNCEEKQTFPNAIAKVLIACYHLNIKFLKIKIYHRFAFVRCEPNYLPKYYFNA